MIFFSQIVHDFTTRGTSPVQLLLDALTIFALLGIAFVVLQALRMAGRLLWFDFVHFVTWRKHRKSYSALRPNGKRILILGDSTAFGRGAAQPEDSIAGRLGRDFPHTEIINLGVNGATTSEVVQQLAKVQGQHFNLVLLFTGGNDIWHFTSLPVLTRALTRLISETAAISDHKVVVLFYANFGLSPLFPPFIRSVLVRRMLKVRDLFIQVCNLHNVAYIELFPETDLNNPFSEDPKRYFSYDYTHPSSEGYRLWYNRMWREMQARGYQFEDENRNPANAAVNTSRE